MEDRLNGSESAGVEIPSAVRSNYSNHIFSVLRAFTLLIVFQGFVSCATPCTRHISTSALPCQTEESALPSQTEESAMPEVNVLESGSFILQVFVDVLWDILMIP